MKAWVFRAGGKPSAVLRLEQDYPRPIPKGKQLIIKVHAAALNPVGWKSMSTFPLSTLHKKPSVPESDFAGTVAGGALDGTGFSIGDEVFGITPADVVSKTGHGTLAEYTLVEPAQVVKKPKNISFEQAAAFPLAGLTAWHAIVDTGVIKKGGDSKRVFINGGTGAVGIQAIQIAKLHGAHVTVSCSSGESASLVKSLGADETIDYKSVSLPSHLSSNNSLASGKAFDLIFDAVGSHTLFAASAAFLKPDGKYLDIAGGIHFDSLSDSINTLIALFNQLLRPRFLGGTPRKFQILLVPAAKMGAQLQQAADLLESKDLRTVIDSTYKFEDALAAYERQMSGRSKGKVVVSI